MTAVEVYRVPEGQSADRFLVDLSARGVAATAPDSNTIHVTGAVRDYTQLQMKALGIVPVERADVD
jgi:hypothetical protein